MIDETSAISTLADEQASRERTGWGVMATLAVGYIGVYLCRKNLAVAMPMLQQSFGATKEQVGIIASLGTLAYAAGKVINGPFVDRVGGRRGFLVSLAAVALFGAAGAFAPGLSGADGLLQPQSLRRLRRMGRHAQARSLVVRASEHRHRGRPPQLE